MAASPPTAPRPGGRCGHEARPHDRAHGAPGPRPPSDALGADRARRGDRCRGGDRHGERRPGSRRVRPGAAREPRTEHRDGLSRRDDGRRHPLGLGRRQHAHGRRRACDREECPSVAAVTWMKRDIAQVTYGNQNWSTAIQGSPPSYTLVRDWPRARGRFFTASDEDGAAKVVVLGRTVVEKLFAPGEDPLGATIRAKNVPLRESGVLTAKGQTSWEQDQDDVVIVPFGTAERRVIGAAVLGTVNRIMISAPSPEEAVSAEQEIHRLLHERHRTPPGQDDDFTVRNMAELFEASLVASRVMTQLLATIASISLVVGGIGIMNVLLVSVTERTREIGIRLAVGAKARHILLQFLVESAVLSMTGGVLGTVLGVGAALLIGHLAGWPILLSPSAVALAFLFSGAVGLVFGVYPARRAARLDPIVALRHE